MGIFNVTFRAIAWITSLLDRILNEVFAFVGGIFGFKRTTKAIRPAVSKTAGELEQMRQDLMSRVRKMSMSDVAVGDVVHRYASADACERASIDLGPLTAQQKGWLQSLSDDHLRKLADVGPSRCERAAQGQRCGIIGMPIPQDAVSAPIYNESKRSADELVYDRFRAMRRARSHNELSARVAF